MQSAVESATHLVATSNDKIATEERVEETCGGADKLVAEMQKAMGDGDMPRMAELRRQLAAEKGHCAELRARAQRLASKMKASIAAERVLAEMQKKRAAKAVLAKQGEQTAKARQALAEATKISPGQVPGLLERLDAAQAAEAREAVIVKAAEDAVQRRMKEAAVEAKHAQQVTQQAAAAAAAPPAARDDEAARMVLRGHGR